MVSNPQKPGFLGLDISTPIAKALVTNQPVNETSIQTKAEFCRGMYPFSVDPALRPYCAHPFRFSDGARAALALYTSNVFYTSRDISHLAVAAEMFPNLYQATRNEISLSLIHNVTRIVQSAEQAAGATVGLPKSCGRVLS